MDRKLIVFSGADRVGKSSLIGALGEKLGDDAMVFHHGAPPHEPENIFDFYREHIQEWVASEKQFCLFDRAWPCSYALETFRRHNNGHLDDLIDLEIELMDCPFDILHVLIYKPWSWAARHHVEEIRSLNPTWPLWKVRDEYVFRMREHKLYYEQLREFFKNTSAFPYLETTNDKVSVKDHADIITAYLK